MKVYKMFKIRHANNRLYYFLQPNCTIIPVQNHSFSLQNQRQMHKKIWDNKVIILQSHIKNIEKAIYYRKDTPMFFTQISSCFSTTTTVSQDLNLNEFICKLKNKFQKSKDDEPVNNNIVEKNLDKLIGAQNIKDVIESGYYVDKTKYLQYLIESGFRSFLIRPKHFGKSLLLDTVTEICKGKSSKKLFENTAIGNSSSSSYKWKKYPVLKFDFSTYDNTCIKRFKQKLIDEIKTNYNKYNIKHDENERDIRTLLVDLFNGAVTLQNGYEPSIVILIDEYDSPLYNCKIREHIIPVMRHFFAILKSPTEIRKQMVLVTGNTRFGKIDISHAANNFIDITDDENVNAICGFTHLELTSIFKDQIVHLCHTLKKTEDEILCQLKDYYSGYKFSERSEDLIYNPLSIVKCFREKKICSYWKGINLSDDYIDNFTDVESMLTVMKDPSFFAVDYDLTYADHHNKISVKGFLFQAGYLTIKDYDEETQKYTLMIPNIDAKISLKNMINNEMFFSVLRKKNSKLLENLINGNAQGFIHCLKPIFSSWPFNHKICDSTYYLFLLGLLKPMSEMSHEMIVESKCPYGKGSEHLIIATPQYVYIFKLIYFKCDLKKNKKSKSTINESNESEIAELVKDAIEKIYNNEYYLPYKNTDKTVFFVGIVFSGSDIVDYDIRKMSQYLAEKEKEKLFTS